ncbi:MAG: mechanosensitive ion channel family protein [bacterium]
MDILNKINLLDKKFIHFIFSVLLFFVFYLFLVFVKNKLKKTDLYQVVIINNLLDSFNGWILPITLNIFLLYVFSFLFVNPKIFKIFVVSFILILGVVLSKFLGRLIYYYTSLMDKNIATSIIINLIRIIFLVILLLVTLDYMGITITPILTSLGIAGLAISLALQSTLSNLFSGLQIIANKQIKVGDYIQLKDGFEGFVEDIKWYSTIIRELSNNIIIIPNSVLTNTIVRNFNIPSPHLDITLKIRVSYDSDLEFVEKITIDIAKKVLNELNQQIDGFEPFIRYTSFSDFSIEFNLIIKVKEYSHKFLIIHNLIKRIHQEYKKYSIIIPYPITNVILEQKFQYDK